MQTDTALPRIAYTVAEVAQMIGRSKKAVYAMCARGALRKKQDVPGGNVYIPADALAEWQASGTPHARSA
jgi:excisionase family DNA binding protein